MSKKLAFCSMMAALGILSMLVSVVLSSNTVFFFLFSTLFTYICAEEYGKRYGLLVYFVISAVSLMLLPNKVSVAFYAAVVGYYPVIKLWVERAFTQSGLRWAFKFAFFGVAAVASYFITKAFLTIGMPFGVLTALAAVLFLIYDFCLTIGIRFYSLRVSLLDKKGFSFLLDPLFFHYF